ncbi:MAG: hypothetical protein C4527_13530 [Candidatus Omnitrophota bacterium]|jgi:hypothetical protein|nr:MAG: hypothetical protein C4527_13530 [Candidatus Omnitrophota bacterium]
MKTVLRFALVSLLVVAVGPVFAQLAPVKQYECHKVAGAPPVIDGNYTEAEWAGSQWTGDFYGLRHSANNASYRGKVVDEQWRWRALWDDDCFYFLIEAGLRYLNPNGVLYSGDLVNPLTADDTGFAGWGTGRNVDFEVFIEPDWQEGDGFNDMEGNSPAYQLCYFPLKEDRTGDTIWAQSNFGIRGAEGPPFFNTGNVGGTYRLPGGWNPICDAAQAAAAGVKPFLLAAQPHFAPAGSQFEAFPVLEIAFPYSQFGFAALPDLDSMDQLDMFQENLIMLPDKAGGKYVLEGDEWLINITGYVDNVIALQGLTLITWNDMGEGGFHNYPRGIMKMVGPGAVVGISDWMMY